MAEHLVLIRHGLIAANKEGRWHGSTDSPLTWRGGRQAKRTARHVSKRPQPFESIYVSPLQRCRSTAAPIASTFKLEPVVHHDLREWGIGEWEDKPFSTLMKDHDFVGKVRKDPDFQPPGGGESLSQVANRMVAAIREINQKHEGSVAVVSHGASIAIALAVILDNDWHRWGQYMVDNCSLTELVLGENPYVNFFNRTEHL